MTIDEKIGRLIKFLFVLAIGLSFFPLFYGKLMPYVTSQVEIPSDMLTVFLVSVAFFYLVYLYKILKGY